MFLKIGVQRKIFLQNFFKIEEHSSFQDLLTIFEKLIVLRVKRKKRKDKQTSRTQFLIEEYILGVGAYDVQLSDMTTDDLNMALYAATLVDRPDSRLLNKVMDIVQEFRKRENAPHKERIIAHTILFF